MALAKLVNYAGQASLVKLFDVTPKELMNFFCQSFRQEGGQFGFANHWLAERRGKVVGCVTAWHTQLPDAFHQCTLSCILNYFGAQKTLQIVDNSIALASMLPAPQEGEFCIGHLAVAPEYRRQGIARQLFLYVQQQAMELGTNQLILDVALDNHAAVAFYKSMGLVSQRLLSSDAALALGFSRHQRLCKPL